MDRKKLAQAGFLVGNLFPQGNDFPAMQNCVRVQSDSSHCRIAQSVEQLTVNQRVVGSSPTAAATFYLNLKRATYSLLRPTKSRRSQLLKAYHKELPRATDYHGHAAKTSS